MAGIRKTPTLGKRGNYFCTNIYRPDGSRTTISFGPAGERTEGEIYAAFGQWLDLFNQYPHKVLSFKSPYEAVKVLINPKTIVTIGELVAKYLKWLEEYSLPMRDGRPSPDVQRARRAGKFLQPYAEWAITDFGPPELVAVQNAMVAYRYFKSPYAREPVGYTRTGINQMIGQIHKIWKWGIGRKLTTENQAYLLKEVRSLRAGNTIAREKLKRSSISEEEFGKVSTNLTSVVADMLRVIWLTAMRPDEVCRMRPFDILQDDPACWLYVPGRDVSLLGDHKTAHHRRVRAVPLTATVQAILRPRMENLEPKTFIFRPADAIQEMKEKRLADHSIQKNYLNQIDPMITPGERYTASAVYTAVRRACQRAGVERFTPYDLRRSAATRVRASLGKDAARLLLGHVSTDTTEIYLLDEVRESIKMAKQLQDLERAG